MAVDAAALVEPSFFNRGIGADTDEIVTAKVDVVGDVEVLRDIAAGIAAGIKAVHPDLRVAENAVEGYFKMPAAVGSVHGEGLAIPAHTCLGVLESHGLIAVAVACLSGKRQVDNEVEWHIHPFPARGVELRRIRSGVVNRVRLCDGIEILGAAAVVLLRTAGIAEGKLPAGI